MTTITSKFTKERLIDWAVVAVAERGRDLKDAPESVEAARGGIREWSGLNYLAEFVFSCGISLWEVHNKTERKTPA
ncbi:hypothetical protein VY443_002527 [Salmonella enterica]|nr:hypothetical protein [Salmonella enterica]